MGFLPKRQLTAPQAFAGKWITPLSAATFVHLYQPGGVISALGTEPGTPQPVGALVEVSSVIVAACLWEDEALSAPCFPDAAAAARGCVVGDLTDLAGQITEFSGLGDKEHAVGARFPDGAGEAGGVSTP